MSIHGIAAVIWFTVFLTPAIEAQSSSAGREQQLRKLEEQRTEGLNSEAAHGQKIREIMDDMAPEDLAVADFDFSGVWQVRVEKLSIWAPRHTLNKTIGMTRWKLSVVGDDISLREYSPDANSQPSPAAPQADPFTEVEVSDVIVRDDLIAFKVKGAGSADEHYRLEQFSENEIAGTYLIRDRLGGPDHTPEYRGRLILEKVE